MSSPLGAPAPRNRLTIAFLMLWTLGSAVILASSRALEVPQQNDQLRLVHSLYLLGYSLTLGVALACVPLFISQTIRRQGGFPTQPGHWLLLVRGFTTLAWLVGWWSRVAIQRFWYGQGELDLSFSPSLYLSLQYVPASLIAVAGYGIARRQSSNESRLWRLTLGMIIFNSVIGVLMAMVVIGTQWSGNYLAPYSWNLCVSQIVMVLLICAAIADPNRALRDFYHWMGVICYVLIVGLPWGYSLLINVLRG